LKGKEEMKKVFSGIIITLAAIASGAMFFTAPVYAEDVITAADNGPVAGIDSAQGTGVPTQINGDTGIVRKIINILLYVIAIISVIMLIIGGLKYVVSGGNNAKVSDAKNTILYAIIGLVVAIFAYAIIRFVVGQAIGNLGSGGTNA
jgi:hypothetical protein cdiviTM7_00647